jgi:hypothetical protein
VQRHFSRGHRMYKEVSLRQAGATIYRRLIVLPSVLAFSAVFFLTFAQPQNNRRVLRTVHEVNQLSNIDARNALPVEVEGVATYSDPEWGLLFLQDDTGAIYVNVHGITSLCPVGSRIRVNAVTGAGDVGTVLVNPHIQLLGQGVLPIAERRTLADLNAKAADSRYVQTVGLLRPGDQPWNRICFRIVDGNSSALVVVPEASNPQMKRMVGTTVRVRGVSGIHLDPNGKILGAMLFVNRPEDIQPETAETQKPNVLAVIVNRNNPVGDLSIQDLRRILLGERLFWKGSQRIVLLLPNVGTPEREATLRLLGMEESAYKKYWSEKASSAGVDAAPVSAASGFAVNVVATTADAIAMVLISDVKSSVKVINLDGHSPADPAYPLR